MARPHIDLRGSDLTTVQRDSFLPYTGERRRVEINRRIVQMAEAEYARQYSQTIPRLRERGGLGIGEVVMLMAEALLRYAPAEALIPECDRIEGGQSDAE